MSLLDKRSKNLTQSSTSLAGYPQYLSHKDEPTDTYREYLDDGVAHNADYRNPRNFFDDLSALDNRWLKIAREYLRNARFS